MKKQIYVCNLCGEEAGNKDMVAIAYVVQWYKIMATVNLGFSDFHLCLKCLKAIKGIEGIDHS